MAFLFLMHACFAYNLHRNILITSSGRNGSLQASHCSSACSFIYFGCTTQFISCIWVHLHESCSTKCSLVLLNKISCSTCWLLHLEVLKSGLLQYSTILMCLILQVYHGYMYCSNPLFLHPDFLMLHLDVLNLVIG